MKRTRAAVDSATPASFAVSKKVKLDPFNGGDIMPGVRVTLHDGVVLVGLQEPTQKDGVCLRLPDACLTRFVPATDIASVSPVVEPRVSELSYQTDIKKGIGGLGTHRRRHTYPDSEVGPVGGGVRS